MARIDIEKRKLIVQKYCRENVSLREIAKSIGCSKDGARKIIKKYGEHCVLTDLPKSHRRSGPADPKKEEKVLHLLKSNKSMSVRLIAKKSGLCAATIQKIKKRHNMKTYKKQKTPKRSQDQQKRAKIRSGKLYSKILENPDRCILMDDETYVKMDTSTLPGPQYYTAVVGEKVDDQTKTIAIEKFGKKVLVWQAICSCGKKSTTFYTTGTISGEVYRKECISKRLLPLYRKHETPPLFWPDLASAHYARETLELLQNKNVEFVKKEDNPPNCPQLRPIETYWALAKARARKDGRESQNLEDFKKIWRSATIKINAKIVQNLMKGVKSKVRSFYRAE